MHIFDYAYFDPLLQGGLEAGTEIQKHMVWFLIITSHFAERYLGMRYQVADCHCRKVAASEKNELSEKRLEN